MQLRALTCEIVLKVVHPAWILVLNLTTKSIYRERPELNACIVVWVEQFCFRLNVIRLSDFWPMNPEVILTPEAMTWRTMTSQPHVRSGQGSNTGQSAGIHYKGTCSFEIGSCGLVHAHFVALHDRFIWKKVTTYIKEYRVTSFKNRYVRIWTDGCVWCVTAVHLVFADIKNDDSGEFTVGWNPMIS